MLDKTQEGISPILTNCAGDNKAQVPDDKHPSVEDSGLSLCLRLIWACLPQIMVAIVPRTHFVEDQIVGGELCYSPSKEDDEEELLDDVVVHFTRRLIQIFSRMIFVMFKSYPFLRLITENVRVGPNENQIKRYEGLENRRKRIFFETLRV